MNEIALSELANLYLALSDQTRLRLLALMAGGEVSVGFLADSLGESQPKVSRHLAYLRTMGVVTTRRDGKWVYYKIASQTDTAATSVLSNAIASVSLITSSQDNLARRIRLSEIESLKQPAESNSEDDSAQKMAIFLL